MSDNSFDLDFQVSKARRTIAADGYPISIGELTNMYKEGELVIRPEYQRLFRWNDYQKSSLVESLLLGIPIPSIFVAQQEDGRWELVDGLQRISTILELQGELLDEAGKKIKPLVMVGTKFLEGLSGMYWDSEERLFPVPLRLDVKRSKVDVKIIKRESSKEAKYDLFQRLNSYGSTLTPQEVRSAMLVSVSPDFFSWLEEMAKFEPFVESVTLPGRLIDERYDLELILRFLVLHDWAKEEIAYSKLKDFSNFLDEKSMLIADDFPSNKERLERVFKDTFSHIDNCGGESIFRRWDAAKSCFKGPFLNTAFEVFALGVGYNLANSRSVRNDLLELSKSFWSGVRDGYATGRSTAERMYEFIPIGRDLTLNE